MFFSKIKTTIPNTNSPNQQEPVNSCAEEQNARRVDRSAAAPKHAARRIPNHP